jgi:allantoicase
MAQAPPPPPVEQNPFAELLDLASARLGGLPLASSDDFFAEKENLLKPEPAEFVVGAYTDRGKWMDGWESRRNRDPAKDCDWVVVRLGLPGKIHGVDIDTSYFVGNAPEAITLEALDHEGALRPHEVQHLPESAWSALLPETPVARGAHNFLPLPTPSARVTHLRLKIVPDGGVARLRAYGEVLPDWSRVVASQLVDLASIAWGGKALASNDSFFSPRDNINLPGSSHGRRLGDAPPQELQQLGRRRRLARPAPGQARPDPPGRRRDPPLQGQPARPRAPGRARVARSRGAAARRRVANALARSAARATPEPRLHA